jgi:hypothetical protein
VDTRLVEEFLKSFFLLFGAKLEQYRVEIMDIDGIVSFENGKDTQQFRWRYPQDMTDLNEAKNLCNFLQQNTLLEGDKILISEPELANRLSNSGYNSEEVERSISELLSIEIKMVDEGRETDSFFVHF